MATNLVLEQLEALRDRLGGRAAGAWSAEDGRLRQVAFAPAPDMAAEVAKGFASATLSVDLARLDLGIVRAAREGHPVESVAEELPAETGSGYWLRAFGATRSIAVPILDEAGRPAFVVSLALGPVPGAAVVEAAIREGPWTC